MKINKIASNLRTKEYLWLHITVFWWKKLSILLNWCINCSPSDTFRFDTPDYVAEKSPLAALTPLENFTHNEHIFILNTIETSRCQLLLMETCACRSIVGRKSPEKERINKLNSPSDIVESATIYTQLEVSSPRRPKSFISYHDRTN